MRRCASIAILLISCFLAIGTTASAQTIQITHSGSVVAASDSSGVSITIEQSGMSTTAVSGSGGLVVTIESSLDEETLVCTLDPSAGNADISFNADGSIEVTWNIGPDDDTVITLPSIRIAGLITNFTCEPVD